MTEYSALSPVSAVIYAALHVSDLLALAPGGVGDDIPQGAAFPFVLFDVAESDLGSMGTRPGRGRTLQVALRLTVFSQQVGMREAQTVMAKALQLLTAGPLAVQGSPAGFEVAACLHDETIPVGRDLVAGVVVNALVATLRLYVTETR